MTRSTDLFVSVVPERRLHPAFRALCDSRFHREAKALMNAFYVRMGDPNGNFLGDFQADGFHRRLFELACFGYLESAGFALDRSYLAPDFLVSRDGVSLAVEATTANPPTGRDTDISVRQMEQLSPEEIFEKVNREFPRRMMSILRKKLARRYDELPHCKGKPLILMVAPFFEPGAVFYNDDALVNCLYGTGDATEGSRSVIPFFFQPEARSVSAILYCNAFTVPRFFRLATPLDRTEEMVAIRRGMCYVEHSETEILLRDFEYRVGSPSWPLETWSEGVTLFHNPNALVPVPSGFLPSTSNFSVRDGCLVRDVQGFHPVVSFMIVRVSDVEATELAEAS